MLPRDLLFFIAIIGLLSCSPQKRMADVASPYSTSDEVKQRQFKYYYFQSLTLYENNEWDQALETLELCLTLDPNNADAHAKIANIYSKIGLNDLALKHYAISVQLDPTNWWYIAPYIIQLSETKQWEKAIKICLSTEHKILQKEELYTILAILYQNNNEFRKAIKVLNKLGKRAGIDEQTTLSKSSLYFQLKQPQKGMREIERLISKYPDELHFQILKANILLNQRKPNHAIEIFKDILSKDPKNVYGHTSLANYFVLINQRYKANEYIANLLKSQEFDGDVKLEILDQYQRKFSNDTSALHDTKNMYKLLSELYPLNVNIQFNYVNFLVIHKKLNKAIEVLEKITKLYPTNEEIWSKLINIYFKKYDFKKMLMVVENALENNPTSVILYYYKCITLSHLKDSKNRLETAQKAILLTEGKSNLSTVLYHHIAESYYDLGEYNESFKAYEQAILLNPNDYYTMNNYAYLMSLQKWDLAHAESLSAKTVENDPKNHAYLDTYAWILFQQKKYNQAKFYIERAIENILESENDGVLYDHYGDILWMLHNDEKALEMWNKAQEKGLNTVELKQKILTHGFERE